MMTEQSPNINIDAKRLSAHPLEACKFFYINLDRAPDRREGMEKKLADANLAYERIVAIDGQKLTAKEKASADEAAYMRYHGKQLNPNEIGCYLSHIRALEAFLASDYEFGIILEDDVLISANITRALETLLAHKDDWDVVKLCTRHRGLPVKQKYFGYPYRLVAYMGRCTGAGAYLVNRYAAQRYCEELLPMIVPYDHIFDRAWQFKFKFRGIEPYPIDLLYGKQSTIKTMKVRRKKWWQRLPVFFYRANNETRRIIYNIAHGLFIPRK